MAHLSLIGSEMQKNDRIIGVDIAKIVAMLLVVALHINGFGLTYVSDKPPGLGYLLLRSSLDATFGACINIFAIASGYVGIMSSFRFSRIIRLWIQVVFTGLTVLVCLDFLLGVDVDIKDYFKACVPVGTRQYWYITAYFMLCFVAPLINAGIKALDEKGLRHILLLLLCVICGESFACSAGALGVEGGYSFEWLVVLYVVGAYIRLYNLQRQSKWALLGCVCSCAMIVGWGPHILRKLALLIGVCYPRLIEFGGYTSPFTVVIAFCIFVLCLRVRIESGIARRVITFLSSTTLGVYLIHVQPVFFRNVFIGGVRKLTVTGGGGYLCSIIFVTVAVFIVCVILDSLRIVICSSVKRLMTK